MLLRTRELLVRQRSQLANAFRAQMSELGIISSQGMASVAKLADKVRDPEVSFPPVARLAMLEMAEQIDVLSDRIDRLGQEIHAGVNADETARRAGSTFRWMKPTSALSTGKARSFARARQYRPRKRSPANW